MVFTGQADACGSHFADDLSVCIPAQGHKGANVRERGEIPVLVRQEDRDDAASLNMQFRQEFGRHALAVHNDPLHAGLLHVLFIALQQRGNTHGEMLIAPMGRRQERVAVLVVEQEQCSAAQDDAQTPDKSSWEQHITVDRLAMSIHITGEHLRLLHLVRWGMPEVRCPAGQSIGQMFCTIGASHL
jgi:hypothetical protein